MADTTYLLGRSTLATRARADAARAHIRNAMLERLKMLRQRNDRQCRSTATGRSR